MPIRREFRLLSPPNWAALSQRVRFERAGGRCQGCGRSHLTLVRCLPDGRWFDEAARNWRDRRGRPARWPDLIDVSHARLTRVVLAAAHLDSNPANNRLANLKSLCQRCHMLHDRPFHLAQRWLTYRRRLAVGDLFLGRYGVHTSRCRHCSYRFLLVARVPHQRSCKPVGEWLLRDHQTTCFGVHDAGPFHDDADA